MQLFVAKSVQEQISQPQSIKILSSKLHLLPDLWLTFLHSHDRVLSVRLIAELHKHTRRPR